MSDEAIVIKIEGEDTEGHASAIQWTSSDESWIKELSDSEKPVRIRIPAEDDTEGHVASADVVVVVSTDDDDVEGHALSLHFPSAQEANDFRRKLMAAGLLTATLAIGTAGGLAIGTAASGNAGNDAAAVSGQYSVDNMGGTQWAGAAAANQGQFTIENQGGTPLAQQQAANQGQFVAENLGGTPASAGSYQGQYSVDNMGGLPAAEAGAGSGQYDAANMGGTPQAPAAEDEVDPPFTPNRSSPR
jgi:hypothetical protein